LFLAVIIIKMYIRCVACLTTTDAETFPLAAILPDYFKTKLTVLQVLELVTSTSVYKYVSPNSICSACLKKLKECYVFIEEFKKSQIWLDENLAKEMPETQTLELEEDRLDKDNLTEILKIECEPEFDFEIKSVDISSQEIISDEMTSESVDTDHTYPIPPQKLRGLPISPKKALKKLQEVPTATKKSPKKKPEVPIAPSKFREIKPKGLFVMSVVDILNSATKFGNIISTREKTNIATMDNKNTKDVQENSVVMSVGDVLNSSSRPRRRNYPREDLNNAKIIIKKIKVEVKKEEQQDEEKQEEQKIKTEFCEYCNNVYSSKRTLVRHKRRMHAEEYKAEVKEKDEAKEEENQQPVSCEICNTEYSSKKSFKSHMQRMHTPDPQGKLKCKTCGVQCRTRSAYIHHCAKHKGALYNCDQCDKVCSTYSRIKYHKLVAHGNKIFLCNQCGERFTYARALRFHEVLAHQIGDKPYMCRYCGFRCLQISNLRRHERCHTNERPYQCKFCEKTFRGRSEMHSHRRIVHERVTRLQCKYCGKMFFRMWNMKLHTLQHKGNYKCTICTKPKTFIDEEVLNFHYSNYHKIRADQQEAKNENASDNDNGQYVSDDVQENIDLNYFMQSDENESDNPDSSPDS